MKNYELNINNQNEKFKYIDALRGYAIFSVLIVHISQTDGMKLSDFFYNFLSNGARGVQLFFIVSALTIFKSFKSRYENESNPIFKFYLRRLFRIAPMYYTAILYFSCLNNNFIESIEGIILNIFFLHGYSFKWFNNIVPGGWTIGVEMIFYLFMPLLFLIIKNIDHAFKLFNFGLLFNAILKYIISNYIRPELDLNIYLSSYFPSQLPVFSLGIILYFVNNEGLVSIDKIRRNTWFSFLIICILSSNNDLLINKVILYSIFLFLFCLLLIRYNSILVNKYICLIGQISYSLYLVHFAVIFKFNEYNYFFSFSNEIVNIVFRIILTCVIAVPISILTYKLIELPIQNNSNRIIKLI